MVAFVPGERVLFWYGKKQAQRQGAIGVAYRQIGWLLVVLVLGYVLALAQQAASSAPAAPAVTRPAFPNIGDANEGLTAYQVRAVRVVYNDATIYATTPRDDLSRLILSVFPIKAGDQYDPLLVDFGEKQLEQLPFIQSVRAIPSSAALPSQLVLVLAVTLRAEAKTRTAPSGVLVTHNRAQFPILYADGQSLLKAVVRGSAAGFVNRNPWFNNAEILTQGNPLAISPPTDNLIDWQEGYAEAGLAGMTPIAKNTWAYGEATYMETTSVGQDIFEDDFRMYGDTEYAVAGVLYSRTTPMTRSVTTLSAGKQPYTIDVGTLIANGAGNGGPRGALILWPRKNYDNAVLLRSRINDLLVEGFYLNPNELPITDTQTILTGANLIYRVAPNASLGTTLIHCPESIFRYILAPGDIETRAGLNVVDLRAEADDLPGMPEWWIRGEFIHETNDRFPMDAHGGLVEIGRQLPKAPGAPNVSYRYAKYTGDNPNTPVYERFDPLLAGSTPDEGVQSYNIVKVYRNANLITHRLRAIAYPNPRTRLTLQYLNFRADTLNNLGATPALAQLQSYYLGQEVNATVVYAATPNRYLVGAIALTDPGTAIDAAVNADAPLWTFLELAYYWWY